MERNSDDAPLPDVATLTPSDRAIGPTDGERGPRTNVITVLVVEPHPSELQRLSQALLTAGFRVVPVEDGHTAVDWAEVFRPQAIVVSAALRDFDPGDVVTWLRQGEAGRAAQIILLAAADDRQPDVGTDLATERRAADLNGLMAMLRHLHPSVAPSC